MRSLTVADTARGKMLRELGCIVCLRHLELFTPPEIHHIDGKTKPDCHQKTLGLCTPHHRIKSNVQQWISRHGDGRAAFEKAYGTEQELLELTNELIS